MGPSATAAIYVLHIRTWQMHSHFFLSNADIFIRVFMMHTSKRAQHRDLADIGHDSKWWLVTPAACFQSGTWSLPVSRLWCYHPLLDVSQWCLLNQNQSRCSWHHPNFVVNLMHTALSLNLQLPTPASIFSFCGKGVHKCITVPSEEFWQTFAH